MVLRMVRLTDDAGYDACETFGNVDRLNDARFQCPVLYSTLQIPRPPVPRRQIAALSGPGSWLLCGKEGYAGESSNICHRSRCIRGVTTSNLPLPNVSGSGSTPTESGADNLLDADDDASTDRRPYVYMNCGHVHGLHPWQASGDT
ncbi:unnamed protein product [Protopolystoma xenopodis]|uniref:Pellino RING domain-containing protein n=1 Tax=Protopolystoma xenopodis TaxID=117903 RepID=A0A448XJW1_9PLAT|nr:unnamed protein product [Protopolystoma xenopodis]